MSIASSPPIPAVVPPDAATVGASKAWPGDEQELLQRLIRDFEEAEEACANLRAEAERSRDFTSGNQWTAEEIAILRKRRQPVIWNNIIGRKVELLRGLERRGRSDPEAFPRNPVNGVRADAATQTLRYIADENRFDVIRSMAYDNMLVEGFGGCEVIVEPQDDGAGYDVVINHIPWNRLYYDPHSQHPAFTDAMYLGVVIWMDRDTATDMYPGCEDILASTLDSACSDTYDDAPRTVWGDRTRRRVRVVQHHWKRRGNWWVATFTKGGFLEAPMPSPFPGQARSARLPAGPALGAHRPRQQPFRDCPRHGAFAGKHQQARIEAAAFAVRQPDHYGRGHGCRC